MRYFFYNFYYTLKINFHSPNRRGPIKTKVKKKKAKEEEEPRKSK